MNFLSSFFGQKMPSRAVVHNPVLIIKTAFNTLIAHPLALYPFTALVFIKLLILEIIYFAVRQPLSFLFRPLIVRFHGEQAMHYPNNFAVVMKWMSGVEIFIFLFLAFYVIGITMVLFNMINEGKKEHFGRAVRIVSERYVHLLVFAVICLAGLLGFNHFYEKLMGRAYQIESVAGQLFTLRTIILKGRVFVELAFTTLITAVFAYVIPIVVIEKEKIFSAFGKNFKILFRSFWMTMGIVFLPALLYVPVLLLKYNQTFFTATFSPESMIVFLVLSILIVAFIDAVQCAVITTYYLLDKESVS